MLNCHSSVILFHFWKSPFSVIFISVSFGESFGCLDDMEKKVDFAAAFDDLEEVVSDRLMDPAWRIREAVTGIGKKMRRDKATIRNHAFRLIEKRRREGYHKPKKDLLQLFIEAKDENDSPLTDEFLVDIVLNFTVGLQLFSSFGKCGEGRERAAGALTDNYFYCATLLVIDRWT